MAKNIFTLFPNLPIELRLQVWREAALDSGSRFIQFRSAFSDHLLWQADLIARVSKKTSGVLFTCKEARKVGLKYFTVALERSKVNFLRVDPHMDVLLFDFALFCRLRSKFWDKHIDLRNLTSKHHIASQLTRLAVTQYRAMLSALLEPGNLWPYKPIILFFPKLKELIVDIQSNGSRRINDVFFGFKEVKPAVTDIFLSYQYKKCIEDCTLKLEEIKTQYPDWNIPKLTVGDFSSWRVKEDATQRLRRDNYTNQTRGADKHRNDLTASHITALAGRLSLQQLRKRPACSASQHRNTLLRFNPVNDVLLIRSHRDWQDPRLQEEIRPVAHQITRIASEDYTFNDAFLGSFGFTGRREPASILPAVKELLQDDGKKGGAYQETIGDRGIYLINQ
ncbi:hypothetical protein B0O99DRAFT_681236 [Bisporella sp. PMI_857]|nr:hypothetical protein B0O99DRAFT_681236 [Bisporella sp. PMI_857]